MRIILGWLVAVLVFYAFVLFLIGGFVSDRMAGATYILGAACFSIAAALVEQLRRTTEG